MPSQVIRHPLSREQAALNRARYLVLTLVQDWIFEENLVLYHESLRAMDARLELINMLEQLREVNRVERAAAIGLRLRLQHFEDAYNNLSDRYEELRRRMCNCDVCTEYNSRNYQRRIRRRLSYDAETSGEETELEELPEHPEDVEL